MGMGIFTPRAAKIHTMNKLKVLLVSWLAPVYPMSFVNGGKNPAHPEAEPVGVLEDFLGSLASADFQGAYQLVAPSSQRNGDPIA